MPEDGGAGYRFQDFYTSIDVAANPPRLRPVPLAETATSGLPRVLIVDDDAAIRSFVVDALAGTADVDTAANASDGLQAISRSSYDAVLVDNELPDLRGVEMIRLLRADPRTATLPLVLFTGHDLSEVAATAHTAGADSYLAKPVTALELEEHVQALLTRAMRAAG